MPLSLKMLLRGATCIYRGIPLRKFKKCFSVTTCTITENVTSPTLFESDLRKGEEKGKTVRSTPGRSEPISHRRGEGGRGGR